LELFFFFLEAKMTDLFMEILNPQPDPVSADCLLTTEEADSMMKEEDVMLIFAASIYPHILWN
jgi:hypothetical protein